VVISQGEIWWADLPAPVGSGPGFRRPVVVVQGDALNRSRLATAVCVPLTSNLRWADAPGNVLLASGEPQVFRKTRWPTSRRSSRSTGTCSTNATSKLSRAKLELLLSGLDVILGR